jgi:hypothetical protein
MSKQLLLSHFQFIKFQTWPLPWRFAMIVVGHNIMCRFLYNFICSVSLHSGSMCGRNILFSTRHTNCLTLSNINLYTYLLLKQSSVLCRDIVFKIKGIKLDYFYSPPSIISALILPYFLSIRTSNLTDFSFRSTSSYQTTDIQSTSNPHQPLYQRIQDHTALSKCRLQAKHRPSTHTPKILPC